ncbi:retrograde regulation protein 2 [Rhizodiscina lignyota]|uniref:Retrograde regulation protein 2 n=1 Tax=Rhizodiscina lignyota TaxID=1504668 RepID=A0A9P4IJ66_9PEZI|nr:retrograde regulation protein 2 [Rhizodiscina lignyota]
MHEKAIDEKAVDTGVLHNEEVTLVRRIDLRILPLCCWIYLLNYLDRGNIGNAKVLNQETGDSLLQQANMNTYQYAVAITLFSLAYGIFEVPSNFIMKRYVRPSLWLGFLLFGWGALTIGFAGVQNYATVVVLRFLIGVFEAGFFPGIVYFITMWYRVEERALRIACVVAHANLAGAFGGCIAYGVGKTNGTNGLQGFRWLFIIEGLITALCTVLVIWFLPDYPSRARWLNEEDKQFANDRLQVDGGGFTKRHASKHEIKETLIGWRMLAHYFTYTVDCIPLGSFTFYIPTMVAGLGYTSLEAQLLTIPPWVCGYLTALTISFIADRYNARGYMVFASGILGGTGWLIEGILPAHAFTARYGCLILAACGAFPASAPLTAWVTCNVPSVAMMAIATAVNNSCAGTGQIVAQWIWKANEANEGYPTGNYLCAACMYVVAIMGLVLRYMYGRMNKNGSLDAAGEKRVWAY